jgi:hypothetical protein
LNLNWPLSDCVQSGIDIRLGQKSTFSRQCRGAKAKRVLQAQLVGDRTYKLGSSITSEYGRYVKSLGEPRDGLEPSLYVLSPGRCT